MKGQSLPALGLSVVIGATVCLLLAATGLLVPVQRVAQDALLRTAQLRPPPLPAGLPDAAIVALDAPSLRAFPQWPWPRSLHARLVRALEAAGVRAIAFDVDFSTPRRHDEAFARALADSGRVALAAFRQLTPLDSGGVLEVASLPAQPLVEAAAATGSVLMPTDADGVMRRAPRANAIHGATIPALAGAALAVALREDPRAAAPAESTLDIDYRRALPAPPLLSFADVIEGRFDPAQLAGRVVFVGATAAEFQDLWATPLGPARPGVWIQAMVFRTLVAERAGASVLRPAGAAKTALAVVLLAGLGAALSGVSPLRRLVGFASLAPLSVAGCAALLVARGVLLDPVLLLLALAGQYLLGVEGLRRRLGLLAEQRERSLSALFQVGRVAAAPGANDPLGIALALLGDVVGASHAALLGAGADGALDGSRIEWHRDAARGVGCPATAARALARREACVLPRGVAGHPSDGGLAVYLPVARGERSLGVLVVERDRPGEPDETQLRTIQTVGAQIALFAENVRLLDSLRRTFDSSVEAVASAVEARDGYTEAHCRRLAAFSVLMAHRLGLDAEETEAIRLGALLHDVGKIGIRDEVLLKAGRLTHDERTEMERHAVIGHRVVQPIHGLSPTTIHCVRHHHERWNGRGYPDGLAGDAIPLGARIVAIVDVWDALSTDRPYKRAYPQARVREMLAKERGEQFDPALVELFLELLDEEGESMLALGRPLAEATA